MLRKFFKKFGFEGESDFFHRSANRFSKGFYILSAAVGTVLIAIGSSFVGGYEFSESWGNSQGILEKAWVLTGNPYFLLAVGIISFLFGTYGNYIDQDRQRERMEELKKENRELESVRVELNSTQEEMQASKSKVIEVHQELVTTWIKELFNKLSLGSEERITIYYEFDEEFFLLARYSSNPVFAKIHRQKFPLNQGVISRAWQHNNCVEKKCPHASDFEEYSNYLENEYGYESVKIKSFTMKACRYLGQAIKDADVHKGVIVFESTREDFLTGAKDKEILRCCDESQSQLSKFVRDSLSFDREVAIGREGKEEAVEEDFIRYMGGQHE